MAAPLQPGGHAASESEAITRAGQAS